MWRVLTSTPTTTAQHRHLPYPIADRSRSPRRPRVPCGRARCAARLEGIRAVGLQPPMVQSLDKGVTPPRLRSRQQPRSPRLGEEHQHRSSGGRYSRLLNLRQPPPRTPPRLRRCCGSRPPGARLAGPSGRWPANPRLLPMYGRPCRTRPRRGIPVRRTMAARDRRSRCVSPMEVSGSQPARGASHAEGGRSGRPSSGPGQPETPDPPVESPPQRSW